MDWLKNKLDALQMDFVKPRKIFASISAVAVLASWILFFVYPGPQWGIDFQGGTEILVEFNADYARDANGDPIRGQIVHLDDVEPVGIDAIRDALAEMDLGDDVVQSVGAEEQEQYQIRIKDTTEGSDEMQAQVMTALRGKYGADQVKDARTEAEVGTRMVIPFAGKDTPPIEELQELLTPIDEAITVADSKERGQVSVTLPGIADLITAQLDEAIEAPFVVLSTDSVGPKVGSDLATQGFVAIMITLGLVLVYIAFRFDIAFAPGAVLALLHDVSLTAGVFVIIGLEINLAIVGALLTIVGYSLNDTIVIYDRIRENQDRYRRKDMPELINVSINETMARTLATSVTTFLAILPFLIFGGTLLQTVFPGMPSAGSVIWSFAFAMLLGIIFGTYSTIYIASPTILVMQDVKPWLNRLIPDFARPGPDDEDEDPATAAALTASEQRRRERAEKARGGGPA